MRQAGVLAAAGLIALEDTPKILDRDHENAKHLAVGLAQIKGIALDPKKVVTNILIFDVRATGHTADEICADLAKRNVLCGSTDKFSVRMVTHYDVDRAAIDRALAAIAEVLHASRLQSQGAQGAA
jgi:threonine aldolase